MPIGVKKQSAERAADALMASKDAQKEMTMLRAHVDHLKHVSQAMWNILRERLDIRDEDLATEVKRLADLEKTPAVAEKCRECSRTLQQGSEFCIYCGAQVAKKALF